MKTNFPEPTLNHLVLFTGWRKFHLHQTFQLLTTLSFSCNQQLYRVICRSVGLQKLPHPLTVSFHNRKMKTVVGLQVYMSVCKGVCVHANCTMHFGNNHDSLFSQVTKTITINKWTSARTQQCWYHCWRCHHEQPNVHLLVTQHLECVSFVLLSDLDIYVLSGKCTFSTLKVMSNKDMPILCINFTPIGKLRINIFAFMCFTIGPFYPWMTRSW